MTDLEMTKLCAEAMGGILGHAMTNHDNTGSSAVGVYFGGASIPKWYDPLRDDTQAMALVKKFRLTVDFCKSGRLGNYWRAQFEGQNGCTPISFDDHGDTALNRAIVECVATMPSGKGAPCP